MSVCFGNTRGYRGSELTVISQFSSFFHEFEAVGATVAAEAQLRERERERDGDRERERE